MKIGEIIQALRIDLEVESQQETDKMKEDGRMKGIILKGTIRI